MHKRIQDELLCDDSLPEPFLDRRPTIRKLSSRSSNQPCGGPRDTIEFIVANKEHHSCSANGSEKRHTDAEGCDAAARTTTVHNLATGPSADRLCQGRGFPVNKDISHKHVPAIRGGSSASARSSQELANHRHQPDTELPTACATRSEREKLDPRDSQSWETGSVLAMWLQAQTVGSKEPSLTKLDATDTDMAFPNVLKAPFQACESISGLSQAKPGLGPTSEESQPLAASNQCHSSPSLRAFKKSPMLSSPVGCTKTRPFDNGGDLNQPQVTLSPSQDLAQSYAVALAFDQIEDASSLVYPSVIPSLPTSPMTSQSNIFYNLDAQRPNSVYRTSLLGNALVPNIIDTD